MDQSSKKSKIVVSLRIFLEKFGKKIPAYSKTIPLKLPDVRSQNIDGNGINDNLSSVNQTGIKLRSI
jgi:hypothetical protein